MSPSSGPVVSARFDAATHPLDLEHPGGVFHIAPKASGECSSYDQQFSGGDRWELESGKTRIMPDEDAGILVRDDG